MLSVCFGGLVCPVGYSPASAAAAMRAGIAAFSDTAYRDSDGQAIVAASVEALPAQQRGHHRLAALAQWALDTMPAELSHRLPWGRMPLILCSREAQRPGARLSGLVPQLRFAGDMNLSTTPCAHVAGGAVSAVQALAMASTMLENAAVPACLVLAVDSLVDARVLSWLEQTERLKTARRTDGVIPGEAACLAIVSRKPWADEASVHVHGLGMAVEPATVFNEEPFRAEGMKQALGRALQAAGLQMHQVDFRLSDVAGESYAFEELVLAQARLMHTVRAKQPLWHPADCVGDCGAAAGWLQLAWAAQAFHRGYAPGAVAALHTNSVFGTRAAAVVAAPTWRPA